jgi:hypothetical protein
MLGEPRSVGHPPLSGDRHGCTAGGHHQHAAVLPNGLVVAAEAIFLTEVAGEATHRLSLRAAYFMADAPDKRRYIRNHFREA